MPLFLIAIIYLLMATASNSAIMLLSYSGPSLLIAFSGVLIRFLEFGIIYTLAKRHASNKHLLFFKAYWVILVAASLINFSLQGNINYILNLLNLLFVLILAVLLFLSPVQTKLIKVYASFKIVSIGFASSLFIYALADLTLEPNTTAIILLLNLLLYFLADILLTVVAWWSHRQTSSIPS